MREECVCSLCAHFGYRCGQEECECDNSQFGYAETVDDCDDFECCDDEDDDEDDDEEDDCIECPNCGSDAYWTGDCYECEDCGWCGNVD